MPDLANMPELTPLFIAGIILLGAAIGFLSGLFGVGGGFLMSPLLNIVFGIPMPIAIGSGMCQMIGTATTATIRHWKGRAVDVKLALIMLGGTVGGVVIGAQILEQMKSADNIVILGSKLAPSWIFPMLMYVVLLVIIGVGTLRESLSTRRKVSEGEAHPERVGLFSRIGLPPMTKLSSTYDRPVPLFPIIMLGVFIGILQGFLGLGGGLVIVPAFIYWVGCHTRASVGTSLLIIVGSSIAGTIAHARLGNVSLGLVALILVSSTMGAYLGATVNHRVKTYHIRFYFALTLFVSLAIIAAKVLAELGVFAAM